jgi:hypothetical protein
VADFLHGSAAPVSSRPAARRRTPVAAQSTAG